LQKLAGVGARDANHAAVGKKRRMTMAHVPTFCYQGQGSDI
jgi:hypothetical protein